MQDANNGPLRVAIVGAGHRGIAFGDYSRTRPDRMQVVAVADPKPERRTSTSRRYGIPEGMQFVSYEDLVRADIDCDAAINATMDEMHYASTLALVEAGLHVLLEKPIAQTEQQILHLIDAARENDRIIMIGHVLRHVPFYEKVKELIDDGVIGRVLSIRALEAVSYDHMATSFIRGRHRLRSVNPMLLSKSCHDLDIIAWLKPGVPVRRVSSHGELTVFRTENAPPGSGTRCVGDCDIESDCPYSARRIYVDKALYKSYAWETIEHIDNPTDEDKLESLRTDNPYGRCVWRCDNDVVDHQVVAIEFADGTMASFDMFAGAFGGARSLEVIGTEGEIQGDAEAGGVILRKPLLDRQNRATFSEERIATTTEGSTQAEGHGGGDTRLIADFVSALRGDAPATGATLIEDSLMGHRIGFAADRAMREHSVVELWRTRSRRC